MKINFILLMVLFNSCGKEQVVIDIKPKKGLQPITQGSAEDLYNTLPGPDRHVEIYGLVGSSIFQRSVADKICRKIGAVVPDAEYSYKCWHAFNEGNEAEATYQAIPTKEYSINVGNIVGSGTTEKLTQDESTLCQVVTGVYPGA